MEVLHVRKDQSLQRNLRADRDGNLRCVEDAQPLDQDVSSEIKVHFALHRRGLAYAAAPLLDFDAHAQLVAHLWAQYLKPQLPGYGKITLEQLRQADEWVWVRLAELTREGAGCFPCDAALRSILAAPELALVLQPPQRSAPVSGLPPSAPMSSPLPAVPRPRPPASSNQPPAKKRRTQSSARRVNMPEEMVNCMSHRADKQPICFGYNTGRCSAKPPGQRCNNGWH
eukprot:6482105-Amphidinium_carterae.1